MGDRKLVVKRMEDTKHRVNIPFRVQFRRFLNAFVPHFGPEDSSPDEFLRNKVGLVDEIRAVAAHGGEEGARSFGPHAVGRVAVVCGDGERKEDSLCVVETHVEEEVVDGDADADVSNLDAGNQLGEDLWTCVCARVCV